MKDLSPEASQLVSAGREAFRPTEADRARLMAALTGTATLSAGVALAAGSQRSLRAIFGLTHAARVLAVALPVAAAGGYWLHGRQPSPPPAHAAPPVSQAAAAAPRLASPPTPIAPQVVEPPSEPSAPVSPERSGPVGESSKPGHEIREEVALLSKAQTALSRGRPQEALEAIAEHAQRFPRGVLAEERSATRARTLCALGRTQEAAAELKRVEKFNPTSAYLARARESCGFK
jgi:tetratricopeptide (TPR) repeat protein